MSGKKRSPSVQACLVTSPRSGSGDVDLADVLDVLQGQGWQITVREKLEKGDATTIAHEAAKDGCNVIVNCGGDGTLNEIVEAVAGTKVAVGTIPGGTENVWSKEAGISERSRVAATQLASAQPVRVDVGAAEVNGKHVGHFLMMVGLGADGAIMEHVSRSLKNRIGPLAVGVAAAESLPSLKSIQAHVRLDAVHWEGEVTEILIGNTRRYGGFTRITPDAYIDDGLLDVCLFTTRGIVGTGRQMASMLLRQHPSESSAEQYRAAQIHIRASEPLPLQLDGSAIQLHGVEGETDYIFTVMPHALTVLLPRTYSGELFTHGIEHSTTHLKGQKKGGKKG